MLTSEKQVRKRKQRKIRNSEYYDMEKIFDDLYAQGKTDKVFNHLMEIIESEEKKLQNWNTLRMMPSLYSYRNITLWLQDCMSITASQLRSRMTLEGWHLQSTKNCETD